MFDVLDEINYQSYNDFVLRVGRCLPLMGGGAGSVQARGLRGGCCWSGVHGDSIVSAGGLWTWAASQRDLGVRIEVKLRKHSRVPIHCHSHLEKPLHPWHPETGSPITILVAAACKSLWKEVWEGV